MSARVSTIPALAIPSLAGLTYLLLAGAPRSYLLVNATALLLSIALMVFQATFNSELQISQKKIT